jgi:SpoVK/Ycf46/Vps4 family AAA+-type ATPase
MKIIPDKFIILNISNSASIEKIKKNLRSEETLVTYQEEDIDIFAESALQEYKVHIEGVKDVCNGFITEINGNKQEGVILEEIVRILKLNRSHAPRRPPRIMLMGPPGCSKSEHAKRIADKYKLSYIKVSHMVKDMIRGDSRS